MNIGLDKDIYMEEPVGFKDPNRPNIVCKLLKVFQGDIGRYSFIKEFLKNDLHFLSCTYELFLYIKNSGHAFTLIALNQDLKIHYSSDKTAH